MLGQKFTYADPSHPPLKRALIDLIEVVSGRPALARAYNRLLVESEGGANFWEVALAATRVDLQIDDAAIAAIPKHRPLVFIANHPYGIIDGLIMCVIAMRARGDFRILINSALCREPRIMRYMLPIDFAETKEAARGNIQSKHAAALALQRDIPVIIFPAGGIATAGGSFADGVSGLFSPVIDLEWKLFMAKLVQTSQASVVPVYFHGHNSALFQLVSQFSLTLRLALIMHECRRIIGRPLTVSVGRAIPYEAMASMDSRQVLTDYLRAAVYALPAAEK